MFYVFASKECLGIVLGDRKQTENSTADNHSAKGKNPQSFVVNQVGPMMLPFIEVRVRHNCRLSKDVRCPFRYRFFIPVAS
jgi:hypothetical protein